MVCEDLPGPDEAHVLAERIRADVATPPRRGDAPGTTVSIGIATSPPLRTALDLLGAADAAAYNAERAGRNTVRAHLRPS